MAARWLCIFMEYEITAITVQKRNPNRVNIHLNGEFAFGLTRDVAAWLHTGQVLTEEKIASLRDSDSAEVAYQKALHFISYRPRTVSEINKKLSELGFEEKVVFQVVERLKQNNWIGDDQFAAMWVENRSAFRPRSRRMLTLELRQKGVTDDAIQRALALVADENNLAYLAGKKFANRLAGLEWNMFRQKLSAHLGRRGFSFAVINPVVQKIWSEQSIPTEGNILDNGEC